VSKTFRGLTNDCWSTKYYLPTYSSSYKNPSIGNDALSLVGARVVMEEDYHLVIFSHHNFHSALLKFCVSAASSRIIAVSTGHHSSVGRIVASTPITEFLVQRPNSLHSTIATSQPVLRKPQPSLYNSRSLCSPPLRHHVVY